VLGILLAELRLDVIPENGETLTAQTLDLFDFIAQQIQLRLVAVLDIQPRRNTIEESDLVFPAGFNQLLDISALLFGIEISPLRPVLGVVLGSCRINGEMFYKLQNYRVGISLMTHM